MLPHLDELLLHPDREVFKSRRQAEVYIQEDPGRPHHLLDSEPLHTGLQCFALFEGRIFFILDPLTEVCTSTETCLLTPLDSTRCSGHHPREYVTTLQLDFLSHCEPVDLQLRPENPYSGHGGYSSLD
ncbi:Hypothetical predicted protein [Xyrichtys novacula]|uniref:Uncharacterized protein n=1 Tax=Xyrichtys novacula TaxID=13765 RepID=A0AAV1GHG6_XYRNO|nr:Hypothetical predicted protein [Xyrichtys novacula]